MTDTPMTNPLLTDADLPDFAAIRPEHVVPAVVALIEGHRTAIDRITDSGASGFDSVVLASERADFAFSRGWVARRASPRRRGYPRSARRACRRAGDAVRVFRRRRTEPRDV